MNRNDFVRPPRWKNFHPYPMPSNVMELYKRNLQNSAFLAPLSINPSMITGNINSNTSLMANRATRRAAFLQHSRNDVKPERTTNSSSVTLQERQQGIASNHHLIRNEEMMCGDRFQQHLLAYRCMEHNRIIAGSAGVAQQHSEISHKGDEEKGRRLDPLRQQTRDEDASSHNHASITTTTSKRLACQRREQPPKATKAGAHDSRNQGIWDDRFQQLVAYKEEFGHCKVPSKQTKYKSLRNWLGKQREAYKMHKKDPSKGGSHAKERFNKLQLIGVPLDPFSTNWDSRFQELVLFRNQFGHCKVPQQGNSSFTRLGQWLGRQKKDLRPVKHMERGEISFSARDLKRGRLLESVGVRLDEW